MPMQTITPNPLSLDQGVKIKQQSINSNLMATNKRVWLNLIQMYKTKLNKGFNHYLKKKGLNL